MFSENHRTTVEIPQNQKLKGYLEESNDQSPARRRRSYRMMLATDSSFVLPEQTCQRFTLAEIQRATHNFHELLIIGSGGFGKVYRCSRKIGSVSEVAVKRLHSMSNQGPSQFEAEVKVLSKLRHGNLVSLIGYCNERKEMILAYEFMPNGTLEHHLHKADSALSWLQRLKICIGAARGLEYLHTGTSTQNGVIHRDVKTSNILLDAKFAAKISDFGLAKVGPIDQTQTHVSTGVRGTFGYMDPAYFYTGKLTRRSDVYAFGVVLLEVLTGKQAVDSTLDEEQWSLAVWAQDQMKQGKLNQIIDSRLRGQISKKCLKEFASIACHCLRTQQKERPTMTEVVFKLESILTKERESANSVVDEGRFVDKFRSIFIGKDDVMPDDAVCSRSSNRILRTFTYAELLSATNNFKKSEDSPTLDISLYEGWVDERTYVPTEWGVGLQVFVRKKHILMPKPDLKLDEFNHPNLVKLLGHCFNKEALFCIYEDGHYTSLDKYLFRGDQNYRTSLSWATRLKIAVGAAKGLSFLHRRKHPAYNQFKSYHILVDMDFNAQLWDYEVEDSFMASSPYLFLTKAYYRKPNWSHYQAYKLDGFTVLPQDGFGVKSDIYAFGVVMLEILTGKRVYDERRPFRMQKMVKWATSLLGDKANLRTIMDPRLQCNGYPLEGAFKLAQLVSSCLQPTQDKRPSMEEILQVLDQCYQEEINSV